MWSISAEIIYAFSLYFFIYQEGFVFKFYIKSCSENPEIILDSSISINHKVKISFAVHRQWYYINLKYTTFLFIFINFLLFLFTIFPLLSFLYCLFLYFFFHYPVFPLFFFPLSSSGVCKNLRYNIAKILTSILIQEKALLDGFYFRLSVWLKHHLSFLLVLAFCLHSKQ